MGFYPFTKGLFHASLLLYELLVAAVEVDDIFLGSCMTTGNLCRLQHYFFALGHLL
jgi:hypothetical protein